MEIEKQIKILKIVNIALVILMIIVAYLVILKASTLGHSPITTGKLIYLEDISEPENPQVGVYLKLILKYRNMQLLEKKEMLDFLKLQILPM